MKVAHLTSAHPRYDVRIFEKECKSLLAAGYMVSVVVGDGLGDQVRDGVYFHDVGKSTGRLARIMGTTGQVFRTALALDADLYHLHDPELLLVGLRLKRCGKRVLFDSHEDVPVQLLSKNYLPAGIRRGLSAAYAAFERMACLQLDGVIAATPFIRDKFLKIVPGALDICNYPVLGEFTPCDDWEVKRDEVCYVGGVSGVRGAKELVMAMACLQTNTRLNLVGDFSEPGLKAELELMPGWSKVNNLGVLDRDGVRDIYQRSRAGLVTLHPIPNYLDALPIKMFEYMSAGIPVIASHFPLWEEIILRNNCGLCVDPMNPHDIASAITYLQSHPDEARAMGENGRRLVETNFNWRHEEGKLLDFYGRILATQGSQAHS